MLRLGHADTKVDVPEAATASTTLPQQLRFPGRDKMNLLLPHALNGVRLAHLRTQQAVGLRIFNDHLVCRIPSDGASQFHGDVVQMTDRSGAVPNFGRRDGISTQFDAIDKVTMVARAASQTDLVFADLGSQDARIAGFDRLGHGRG